MTINEIVEKYPYLTSPAALAHYDTNGRWFIRPHLSLVNRELVDVAFGGNKRLGVHMPMQHGKSLLCSKYFVAWVLMLFPWFRVILASNSSRWSMGCGGVVREVIERYGGPFGVKLRQDTRAKEEWNIDSGRSSFDGGMVAKGYEGDINGRPCDMFVIDDLIRNQEEAMSAVIKEKHYDFYSTVVFGRLGHDAPILNIGTRWAKDDLAGRLYKESKQTGRQWRVINLKAIADTNDILGRKPGEPLWEEFHPISTLEERKKIGGRFWYSCWQQEPQEETGLLFRPNPTIQNGETLPGWPKWVDIGGAYRLKRGTIGQICYHADCTRLLAVDWSLGKKSTSDFTGAVVADLVTSGEHTGKLFIVHVMNRRLRDEERAVALNDLCEAWQPAIVASDDDMLAEAMITDCRRYPYIPEIRRLPISSKSKKVRAMAAVIHGENGRIYLPEDEEPWQTEFTDQLAGFTGEDGEVDDMADALGIIGRLADSLKPQAIQKYSMPEVLSEGKDMSMW